MSTTTHPEAGDDSNKRPIRPFDSQTFLERSLRAHLSIARQKRETAERRLKELVKAKRYESAGICQQHIREASAVEKDMECLLGHYEAEFEAMATLKRERRLLAKLASAEPQFFNPLVALEAQEIRDRVLANAPAQPPVG